MKITSGQKEQVNIIKPVKIYKTLVNFEETEYDILVNIKHIIIIGTK